MKWFLVAIFLFCSSVAQSLPKRAFNSLDNALVVSPLDSTDIKLTWTDEISSNYGASSFWIFPADTLTIPIATYFDVYAGEIFMQSNDFDFQHFSEVAKEVSVVYGDTATIKVLKGPIFVKGIHFRMSNSAMGDSVYRSAPQLTDGKVRTCPQIPLSYYIDTSVEPIPTINATFENPFTKVPCFTVGCDTL